MNIDETDDWLNGVTSVTDQDDRDLVTTATKARTTPGPRTDPPVGRTLDDCPDLTPWAVDATNHGAHPGPLRDDLLTAITEAVAAHPRSLQTEIGPSELGHPCNRWLALFFAGAPRRESKPPWRPAVGTAVHEHFSAWLHRWNAEHGVRYLTDLTVYVGDICAGRPVFGTLDALDVLTGTIVDLKGLAVDTPIPTPDGWSTMARLQTGDRVFGADGRSCAVTAKSPVHLDRPCYRVTFNDGASVVTDNVHQWRFVADRNGNGDRHVIELSTEDAARQIVQPVTGQRHLRVLNPGPLQVPEIDLPIHPYVLGAWLGDGDRTCGRISLGHSDRDLFDHIAACGYEVGADQDMTTSPCLRRNVVGLAKSLRLAGLIGHKQIPDAYLRGSLDQRLALLQGLMDTDGTWNRKRNQAVFTNTDKALIYATAELVRSLGWKATINEYLGHGFGKSFTAYGVAFVPYGLNPFRLQRKADLVRMEGSVCARHRVVQSIEPVPTQATQCIQVDSADSMFLCGQEMIPTHNCPGPSQMKAHKTAAGGPERNPTYRIQTHLYGRGAGNAGFPVAHVGILRVPAAGELDDAIWTYEPYDEQIAANALARAGGIAQMVDALGPDAARMQPTTEHYCSGCQFFQPHTTDLATGCPGDAAFIAKRDGRRSTLNDLVA